MSLAAFRRIQIGKESVRGTAVAADTILYGTLVMVPEVTWHRPIDERNSLAEFNRAKATAHMTNIRYQGDATYEQVLQFLAMTLKGAVAPVQVAATLAYEFTFTPSLTAVNTQDAFTVEYGDNTQAWESAFVVGRSMSLSWSPGEIVSLSADLFGHMAQKVSFTGSLSQPTVREVIAQEATINIDSTWGNLGTTSRASQLVGGTINLNSGLNPTRYGDGLDSNSQASFSAVIEGRKSHSMDLQFAMGANALADMWDAYEAGTDRAIRIVFDAATDSIESGHNHELEIDMFGKWSTPPDIFGELDGQNLVSATLTSHDDGSGNELSVRVKNAQSTAF